MESVSVLMRRHRRKAPVAAQAEMPVFRRLQTLAATLAEETPEKISGCRPGRNACVPRSANSLAATLAEETPEKISGCRAGRNACVRPTCWRPPTPPAIHVARPARSFLDFARNDNGFKSADRESH